MRLPDLSAIPVGSWPQWILLIVVTLAFIKWAVPWRADEMRKLRIEIRECEQECERRLKKLEEDLWGEKRQRVSEQISFANVLLRGGNNPELKSMLDALEGVQAQMKTRREIAENGGVE